MSYSIAIAPTTEPVSLQEAKTHVRTLNTDFDTELTDMIKRARAIAEEYTSLSIPSQTIDMYFDTIPRDGIILIRRAPVQSVTHVKYYDDDNELQIVETTDYITDLVSRPARLAFTDNKPYPKQRPNAVEIRFVAGWATAAAVPPPIRQAILMLVGSFFENRGDEGHRVIPDTVWKLLNPYRVKLF